MFDTFDFFKKDNETQYNISMLNQRKHIKQKQHYETKHK